jgi:hypothetical protein
VITLPSRELVHLIISYGQWAVIDNRFTARNALFEGWVSTLDVWVGRLYEVEVVVLLATISRNKQSVG